MKKAVFLNPMKICLQAILLMAIVCFSFSAGSLNTVHASKSANTGSCGQQLADAKAKFVALLSADGSIPATPEVQSAAQEYIRVSKLCYDQIEASNPSASLQTETPAYIDEGPMFLGKNSSSANFQATGNKWSSSTITYSFMGDGISFGVEDQDSGLPKPVGNSVAISHLLTWNACFYTEIENAFAAWHAVANITFKQVSDNGAAFDAAGAAGDIRIAAHTFDGPGKILAHAYFPPPNGTSAAGDLHFDSEENWSCNPNSGIDIGMVALHEIGHSLGLDHQSNPPTAVMNPTYNPKLTALQSDDISGIRSIYDAAVVSAPPLNDSILTPTNITTVPFSVTEDTTGASVDGPANDPIICNGKTLYKGTHNVWFAITPGLTANISFDTFGSTPPAGAPSNYDTYIAAWAGSDTSQLSMVGCNDDTANSLQSQLVLKLTGGTHYYIEVAEYAGIPPSIPSVGAGGTLQFHVIAGGGADTTGVFRPSNGLLYLKNQNTSGYADIAINYGQGGDYPVVGDWDGNGTTTIGIYRAGYFYLRNANTIGFADAVFPFGQAGDQPIAGDWNGDGIDTIGVYRSSTGTFYLRNSNSSGPADYVFQLGIPGDVGIAGDWTNKHFDTVGVFRPSNGIIFLKNTNTTGYADVALNYGLPGDQPVVGDWDNNGTDTIGVYRNGEFLLRNENTNGFAETRFSLGIPGDMPIAGNWDGIP